MRTHAAASEQAAAFVANYEHPQAGSWPNGRAKYLAGVPDVSAYTGNDIDVAVEATEGSQMSTEYGGLTFKDARENVAGGPANKAIIDLAKHVQETEPTFIAITALNDRYHHGLRYHSAHTEGRAFDIALGDVGGSQKPAHNDLNSLGLKEGGQRSGDYWIEPFEHGQHPSACSVQQSGSRPLLGRHLRRGERSSRRAGPAPVARPSP